MYVQFKNRVSQFKARKQSMHSYNYLTQCTYIHHSSIGMGQAAQTIQYTLLTHTIIMIAVVHVLSCADIFVTSIAIDNSNSKAPAVLVFQPNSAKE